MNTRETTRVYKDEYGVYHWVYRLPMFRNFSILKTVLKAMGICFLIPVLILVCLCVKNQGTMEDFLEVFGILAIIAIAILIISVLSYLLVAALYGGNYVAIYTMDQQTITTAQPASQASRQAIIGLFTAATGVLGQNPGVYIAGLAGAARQVVQTSYKDIKSLKFIPEKGEIRIHSFLTWYTIYVTPDDFSLVAGYLEGQCLNAKISITTS
ncbi:MAG: hypothetical protein IJ137_01410 [Eubacterium sp.]|nr:hypothetical protein [Eubacterium sp.]